MKDPYNNIYTSYFGMQNQKTAIFLKNPISRKNSE